MARCDTCAYSYRKTIHDECVGKRARLRVSVIPSGLGGLTQPEIRKRAIGKRNP